MSVEGGVDALRGGDNARSQELRKALGVMSNAELALLLGVTEHTTQYWRTNHQGPPFVKLGNNIFYRVSDVADWVLDNVRGGARIDDQPDTGV